VHSQSIDSAFKFFDAGRYEQAAQEFEKVLPLIEKDYGANDTSYYSFLLIYAGVSFEKNHQYARAEQYYLNVKAIYEQINALSNDLYATAINNLAALYRTMGKYENAETFYRQALEISKKINGEEDPGNVLLLNNITTLYHEMGNYKKAEPMYLKALEISKRTFGEEHPNTVSLLNNLGALYDDMGNYEKAESIYLQTLEIRAKVPGPEDPEYALSANNLAQLYFKMGNYDKAEPLYQQALLISKKKYGEEHSSYALALNNLGVLYYSRGDYEKAESLYLEALKIRKNVLGERHPDYATSLSNLALFYYETGNYEKAEPLYVQSSEIRRATLGEEHPEYAVTLNNMALFYSVTGNYKKAETLLLQALDILKNALGEEHSDYAISLNNLALFYNDRGDYERAEPLFMQALKISKKVLGEMHPSYATLLNNLAEFYDATGNFAKAETMYLQALEIASKISGENHPDIASILNNLALLYQDRGYFEKAAPFYQRAMNTYLFQIQQQFSFMSETEKEKYLAKVQFFFKTYQNFIMQQHTIYPAIAGKAYDIELSGKGLLLRADKQLRMYILSSGDSSAIKTYNSWLAVRASLAGQYSMPLAQQTLDTKMMESQANELEKQLARIYSAKNDLKELHNIHWQDVQKKLDPGEVAIEFTHFPFYNGRKWTDSIMYVAIILKHDDIYPKIVYLFEGRQLDSVLQSGRGSDINFINDLYSWANTGNQLNPGKGHQLYDLIWKPLEKYLDGVQNVCYSPSGRLHQLSFAAIPCGERELLSDRYKLFQLSSTAQIIIKHQESPVKKIVLFGGIEYDAGLDKMQSIADQYKHSVGRFPLQTSRSFGKENTRSGSWMYLDGTMNEVEKISKLAEGKGIKSYVLAGNDAIEESIKNLDGNSSPEVIHIATHGFFFPDAEKNYDKTGLMEAGERATRVFKSSENPLMRSGLAFAGVNHGWGGEEIPQGVDDGILTAYEVSNMYIPNTELVVLSACETGLGEIKGSEGVFGLQRSFKIAGADFILMSLWQIPDYQTSELMNYFYTGWFSGKSIQVALGEAQDYMKSKYPFQPFMWAAFVLVR
jgi:tetratricopeptide (TPR) repeat protein